MERLADLAEPSLAAGVVMAAAVVVGGYIAILVGRLASDDRDPHAGLKLVLFGLALVGLALAMAGATRLLATVLGGFHELVASARDAMPAIAVGASAVAGIGAGLLPRTNSASHRRVERFALGAVALQYGITAIAGVYAAMHDLLTSSPWSETSHALAAGSLCGLIAWLALSRLGEASGWIVPQRSVPAPPPPPPAPPPPAPPPVAPVAPASNDPSRYAPR